MPVEDLLRIGSSVIANEPSMGQSLMEGLKTGVGLLQAQQHMEIQRQMLEMNKQKHLTDADDREFRIVEFAMNPKNGLKASQRENLFDQINEIRKSRGDGKPLIAEDRKKILASSIPLNEDIYNEIAKLKEIRDPVQRYAAFNKIQATYEGGDFDSIQEGLKQQAEIEKSAFQQQGRVELEDHRQAGRMGLQDIKGQQANQILDKKLSAAEQKQKLALYEKNKSEWNKVVASTGQDPILRQPDAYDRYLSGDPAVQSAYQKGAKAMVMATLAQKNGAALSGEARLRMAKSGEDRVYEGIKNQVLHDTKTERDILRRIMNAEKIMSDGKPLNPMQSFELVKDATAILGGGKSTVFDTKEMKSVSGAQGTLSTIANMLISDPNEFKVSHESTAFLKDMFSRLRESTEEVIANKTGYITANSASAGTMTEENAANLFAFAKDPKLADEYVANMSRSKDLAAKSAAIKQRNADAKAASDTEKRGVIKAPPPKEDISTLSFSEPSGVPKTVTYKSDVVTSGLRKKMQAQGFSDAAIKKAADNYVNFLKSKGWQIK